MKINGKKIEEPNVQLVVLPRMEGDIGFYFKAVESLDEFKKLCPEPTPPITTRADGTTFANVTSEGYKDAVSEREVLMLHWMFLKSISATPNLTWERVNMQNPETWKEWESELRESKIFQVEQSLLMDGFNKANSLDEAMLDEVRKSFLASGGVKVEP